MLGSGSFNRVDGILTKEVRDLQNQHLHPVATLSVLSMFIFPREGDQRSCSRSQPSCSWDGKDHYSEPRWNPPPGFLFYLLCITVAPPHQQTFPEEPFIS